MALSMATVATLGVATVTAGPLSATTPTPNPVITNRILPFAGDSQVLVYGTRPFYKTLHNYFQVANKHIELWALTASGKRIDLLNTGVAESVHVTVVGSVVAMNDSTSGSGFQVWDVDSGKTITQTLAADAYLVGAAPHGFVYDQTAGGKDHLFEESFAGKVTDLGVPPTPNPNYRFTVGPDGIIAGDDSGNGPPTEVPLYMTWAHPGKWRLLHRAHATWCSDLGKSYAACGRIVPLDGAKPITPQHYHCTGVQMIFHSAMVRICSSGKLHRNSITGKASISRRAYANQGVIHAFNKLIVGSPSQSKLETLTSINAKPKTLLTAAASASGADLGVGAVAHRVG
jgi:hypothetical protein